ncbi:hypothetical protein E2C01_042480 [Portunus trituberculatus]|uniref:Uncharacterized protein n=1 Tax=Portunus trituberculatus TaxID=210409 RepID=A0A5B7FTK2_PORTR|nr:hypothetical protein [Portunus trituberculatus]
MESGRSSTGQAAGGGRGGAGESQTERSGAFRGLGALLCCALLLQSVVSVFACLAYLVLLGLIASRYVPSRVAQASPAAGRPGGAAKQYTQG